MDGLEWPLPLLQLTAREGGESVSPRQKEQSGEYDNYCLPARRKAKERKGKPVSGSELEEVK